MSTNTESDTGTRFPVAADCPTPQEVLGGAAIINPGGDMSVEPICIAAMELEDDGTLHFNKDAATVQLTGGPDGAVRMLRDVSGIYAGPGSKNHLTLH